MNKRFSPVHFLVALLLVLPMMSVSPAMATDVSVSGGNEGGDHPDIVTYSEPYDGSASCSTLTVELLKTKFVSTWVDDGKTGGHYGEPVAVGEESAGSRPMTFEEKVGCAGEQPPDKTNTYVVDGALVCSTLQVEQITVTEAAGYYMGDDAQWHLGGFVEIGREVTGYRAMTPEEIANCAGPQPDDVITEVPSAPAPNCVDGTVDVTFTEMSASYSLENGEWVLGEPTPTGNSRVETTPMNDAERAACRGEQPDPIVEYGEWSNEVATCEAPEVTQARTVTTTEFVPSEDGLTWVSGEPVVTTETQSVSLTPEELAECDNGEEPATRYFCHVDEHGVGTTLEVNQEAIDKGHFAPPRVGEDLYFFHENDYEGPCRDPEPTLVTPVVPTLDLDSAVCGEVPNVSELPEIEGIEYTVELDGDEWVVTATALDGYLIATGKTGGVETMVWDLPAVPEPCPPSPEPTETPVTPVPSETPEPTPSPTEEPVTPEPTEAPVTPTPAPTEEPSDSDDGEEVEVVPEEVVEDGDDSGNVAAPAPGTTVSSLPSAGSGLNGGHGVTLGVALLMMGVAAALATGGMRLRRWA